MKASPSVVNIFTKEGEIKPYKLHAARLPEFLQRFPIAEGWRHVREVAEACSLAPQLAAMHLAAVTAGKKPADLGLPALPQGLVFTSRLFDPNGNEVSSGSATSPALDLFCPAATVRKDYEAAETAAFQRLLASVGIGGEVFNEDEARTTQAMGSRLDLVTSADGAGQEASTPAERREQTARRLSAVAGSIVDAVADGLPDVGSPLSALASLEGNSAVRGEGAKEAPSEDPTSAPAPVESGPKQVVQASAHRPRVQAANHVEGHRPSDAQLLAAMNRQIAALSRQLGVKSSPAKTLELARERMTELQGQLTR